MVVLPATAAMFYAQVQTLVQKTCRSLSQISVRRLCLDMVELIYMSETLLQSHSGNFLTSSYGIVKVTLES